MRSLLFSVTLALGTFLAVPSFGAVVNHVESVDGMFNTTSNNPTNLGAFDVGLNRIEGGFSSFGNDVFRFQISPGQELNGIILVDYSAHNNRMFFGIHNDVTFPVPEDTLLFDDSFAGGDQFLGGFLIGSASHVGTDMLGPIGKNSFFIGNGFVNSRLPADDRLPAGDYTVYMQQTTGPTTAYKFDFRVVSAVPEPSAIALVGLAGGIFLLRKRRQKRMSA